MIIVPSIAEFLAYRDYQNEVTCLGAYLGDNNTSLTEGEVAHVLGVSEFRVKAILLMLSALELVSLTQVKGFPTQVRSTQALQTALASINAEEVLWNLEVDIAACFGGYEFERATLLTISKTDAVMQDAPEMCRTVNGTVKTAEDDLKGVVVTSDQALLLNSQARFQ